VPQTPNVVLRERLIAAADQRWGGGFGIILGGPGLGKSTLVRQAMFESATLGRGTEVLIRCRPDWTSRSLHLSLCDQLAGMNDVDAAEPRPEIVAENLWSMAPQRVGVILDDLHMLDESAITYTLELRDSLPSNAHLVVASRENPLLSALLMTSHPSFVIDGGELLFTDAEVDAFSAEAQVELPALQAAGGWPAVLALTASAGANVAGAYLYQKVLAGLSRQQQGDLAIAAALGEVDAELARSVLDGSTQDLAAIPLVESPAGGGIIVHDLWREPLQGLVDQERLDTARRTAAGIAEASGDSDRAVSVLVEGALTAEAREVILRDIANGADRVPVDRVDRWLRNMTSPDQALLRQTLHLLRTGLIEGSLSDVALDEISDRCRNAGESDLESIVCEIRFAAAWSADETDTCIAMADRLAELYELGVESAAPGQYMRELTEARSVGDNTRVLALIQKARNEVGADVGLDWNISLELETLVALGRPFEALVLLESDAGRSTQQRVRSIAYGLTYWFAGRPDDALDSIGAIMSEAGRFEGLERSWQATSRLFRMYRGVDIGTAAAPERADDEIFSLYSRVCEGLAEAGRAVHHGDEKKAATLIADLKERLPPTGGFTLQAWFMGAAMWYVLEPDDRPLLDAFMTDNFYGAASAVFQSVVAGRDEGTVPERLISRWPVAAQVSILLPTRWAAEVALRLPPERAALRDQVLDGLVDRGQPALEIIASGNDKQLASLASELLGSRANPPTELVRVQLFGQQRLHVAGHAELPDWRRGRVRALFAFLATRSHTTREKAIDALWPELDSQAGRRNLRVTLSYLSRALEPDRSRGAPPWFIRTDGEMLTLETEGLRLDHADVMSALEAARSHRVSGVASKSIESLRTAVEIYSGPFLEGIDDEWVAEERNHVQQQVLNACLRLTALLQAGRRPEAAVWARRAIEIDPFSVDAHETLVEALQGGPTHEIDAARAQLVALLHGD